MEQWQRLAVAFLAAAALVFLSWLYGRLVGDQLAAGRFSGLLDEDELARLTEEPGA